MSVLITVLALGALTLVTSITLKTMGRTISDDVWSTKAAYPHKPDSKFNPSGSSCGGCGGGAGCGGCGGCGG